VSGIRSFDGVRIAYQELGEGRPVVLVHGFMGNGSQWITGGHAAALTAAGFRVIMPDLRGHGESERHCDYPPDVLADDLLALVAELGLDDYDLGGYSLGGRVTLRALVRGARPRRAIIAGQGITGGGAGNRRALAAIARGGELDEEASQLASWLSQLDADPQAMLHVLDAQVPTSVDEARRIEVPTLVVVGDRDERRVSAADLAAALPSSQYLLVPGDHWSAFTSPELTAAVLDWSSKPFDAR
jgi:pimeloyl-ACP methyl ester carboxylesterase